MIERPMLAATVKVGDFNNVEWPVLASPKIDGIRCLIHPTLGPVTRTFKPIPNVYIRTMLERIAKGSYLDGELVAVNKQGVIDFNGTQSAPWPVGDNLIPILFFEPFRNGHYKLSLQVTEGIPELAGVSQRLVARYRLCGLEMLPAIFGTVVGIASLVIGGIIFLVFYFNIDRSVENTSSEEPSTEASQ